MSERAEIVNFLKVSGRWPSGVKWPVGHRTGNCRVIFFRHPVHRQLSVADTVKYSPIPGRTIFVIGYIPVEIFSSWAPNIPPDLSGHRRRLGRLLTGTRMDAVRCTYGPKVSARIALGLLNRHYGRSSLRLWIRRPVFNSRTTVKVTFVVQKLSVPCESERDYYCLTAWQTVQDWWGGWTVLWYVYSSFCFLSWSSIPPSFSN
jgi:hypothetical protein